MSESGCWNCWRESARDILVEAWEDKPEPPLRSDPEKIEEDRGAAREGRPGNYAAGCLERGGCETVEGMSGDLTGKRNHDKSGGCTQMKNKAAQELGRLGKGVKKKITPEERERRREALAVHRLKRWAK